VVPAATRSRGASLIVVAAALYLALHLAGFHKLFGDMRRASASCCKSSAPFIAWSTPSRSMSSGASLRRWRMKILKESGALKDLILFSKALLAYARSGGMTEIAGETPPRQPARTPGATG
jgi:hypothetical protein